MENRIPLKHFYSKLYFKLYFRVKNRMGLEMTYSEITSREGSNGTVSSPVRVSKKSSKERYYKASALPDHDLPRCRDIGLMQFTCVISDQILGDSIVS